MNASGAAKQSFRTEGKSNFGLWIYGFRLNANQKEVAMSKREAERR
jgi:hypothetical protein